MDFKVFDSPGFLVGAFFLFRDLCQITIQRFGKCRVLCFFSRKKSSPIHFAFDQSRPFFRIGFIVESLVLGREALSNDLGLPLIEPRSRIAAIILASGKWVPNKLTMA